MNTQAVRDTARVTVSEAVKGTRRGRGADQRPRSHVTHIKVHPLVWAKAKQLARAGGRKIEIVDASTVIVR